MARNNDTLLRGQQNKISDGAVIQVVRECEDPVVTAETVAARLSISEPNAVAILQRLTDQGVLESKHTEFGSAWWLVS